MKREMLTVVVLAEFDVAFEPGTELGTDDAPSAARIAAEEHVEARVAGMVARRVPTVTLDDVTVRDSWLAPPSCTGAASDGVATCDLSAATDGSADCPVGCNHENSTVMYEVTIFSGEAGPGDVSADGAVRPTAAGAQVFDALRICGDCGTQSRLYPHSQDDPLLPLLFLHLLRCPRCPRGPRCPHPRRPRIVPR